jgi:hypothetical protein
MKRCIFTLLILLFLTVSASAGQRYFVCTLWSYLNEAKDPVLTREYLSLMKKHGFNALSIDAHWNIARPDGTYDFSQFDRIVQEALNSGFHVFVRVNTSCTWGLKPYWLKDEHLACDKSGKPFIRDIDKSGIPSICNREVLSRMADFYTAVAQHCRQKFGSGKIVCFSGAFTLYLESEYWEQIDYSPSAKNDFISWAQKEYSSISVLNQKWGTNFQKWEELDLATAHPTAQHLFFEYSLKRWFYLVNQALKKGDPKASLGMQTGCIYDHYWRRTNNTPRFFDHVQWVFVADAPIYPHRFTCDYLRGISQGKVMVANEIDGPYQETLTPERVLSQGVETWEQGVDTLFLCNWGLNDLKKEKFKEPLRKLGTMAKQPGAVVKADRAIFVSVWDIVHNGYFGGINPYLDFYNTLPDKDKRPVDIINDGVIERDPNVLRKYKEIYLPKNEYMSEASRKALLAVRNKLKILNPDVAGSKDEYKRPTKPFAKNL